MIMKIRIKIRIKMKIRMKIRIRMRNNYFAYLYFTYI